MVENGGDMVEHGGDMVEHGEAWWGMVGHGGADRSIVAFHPRFCGIFVDG